MSTVSIKVGKGVVLSYVCFMLILYVVSADARTVSLSDIKSGGDVFYFLWLFVLPAALDIVVVGLPVAYILKNDVKYPLLLVAVGLGLDFLLSRSAYGGDSAILKLIVYMLVLGLAVRKEYLMRYGRKTIGND